MRRAPISATAPGPNGMMKRTGRCGQLCARAGTAASARPARNPANKIAVRKWLEPIVSLPDLPNLLGTLGRLHWRHNGYKGDLRPFVKEESPDRERLAIGEHRDLP